MKESLFKMGGTDYSQFITYPSYNVNSEPVYKEWEDGNYISHRSINRFRISGSFTLYFHDTKERNAIDWFEKFTKYVKDNTDYDGYIVVSLYDNVTNEFKKDIKVFMSYTLSNEMPNMFAGRKIEGFQVTVKQR